MTIKSDKKKSIGPQKCGKFVSSSALEAQGFPNLHCHHRLIEEVCKWVKEGCLALLGVYHDDENDDQLIGEVGRERVRE